MDSSTSSPGTLQARYRRVLSIGDVLDESIRLFREHWITFALVSAAPLVPSAVLDGWRSASGPFDNGLTVADALKGRFASTSGADVQVGTEVAAAALWVVCYCIWSAAVTAATEAYLGGGQPNLASVYRRVRRRVFTVLLASLAYALGLGALAAIGVVLLIATVFPGLGGVVPGIGLLVWWLRPHARTAWLKWLIVVCIPFGLAIYFSVRWSMFVAAAVLERLGPLAALRRSTELVTHQTIRVLSILSVGNLIVGVLTIGPQLVLSVPFTISSGLLDYASSTEAVISEAARLVLAILFHSIGAIVSTVTFVDLRNRREGTDMALRLTQLEALPAASLPG